MGQPLRCCCRGLLLALLLLAAGCGNEQKADGLLVLDAVSQHPRIHETLSRWLLAETFAAMKLTPVQAKALLAWSTQHGAAVRAELDQSMAEADQRVADCRKACDDMLREGGSVAERRAVAARYHLDAADPLALGSHLPGVPGQPKELIDPATLDQLRPLVQNLTEEQRCIAGGGWTEALNAVVALEQAPAAQIAASRAKVLEQVSSIWVVPFLLDDATRKALQEAIAAIPAGQTPLADPEAALRRVLQAAPAMPKMVQVEVATKALAAMLSLEQASELLKALV